MKKNELLEMIKTGKNEVKNFNITVTKKNGHESKLYEVKKLYYNLIPINNFLFDPENEYNWENYKLNINIKKTKKEIDNNLRLCIMYLYNELNAIEQSVYNNEIIGLEN